ncbi:MAG TPA: UbiD family decarboxylase [Chloroflexota bacterium]
MLDVNDSQVAAAEGDLREFMRLAEETGELMRIDGADPHLEIGALYELSLERAHPPVLLFDNIKGYPPGYRVLMNIRTSAIFSEGEGLAAVQAYRQKRRQVGPPRPIPPEEVETGPVCQNILVGEQVNVLKFPRIQWHEQDGGAYIGTECLIITKDPDSDWVNVGSYRAQIQDEKTISVFIEPGKHGDVIRRKYWQRGEPCPMVISVGQAPILGRLAGTASKAGESEMATAGGRLGRPLHVIQGQITGLPIPADAELVFEGLMHPPDVEARPEGPFGEWPGYYASDSRPEPVVRVQAIYHRDEPIITGAPPAKPTYPGRWGYIPQCAGIWDALEAAGVPGVQGVWKLQGGGSRFITVVSIKQEHPGHAKMAGLVATGCGPAAYLGRLTVIVDDDIDITNPVEVLWAIATRWDPKNQTDIIDGCWTGHIDPILDPAKREVGDITNSRMIMYAVRPYHWKEQFPAVNEIPASYAEQVRQKWAPELEFLRRKG